MFLRDPRGISATQIEFVENGFVTCAFEIWAHHIHNREPYSDDIVCDDVKIPFFRSHISLKSISKIAYDPTPSDSELEIPRKYTDFCMILL